MTTCATIDTLRTLAARTAVEHPALAMALDFAADALARPGPFTAADVASRLNTFLDHGNLYAAERAIAEEALEAIAGEEAVEEA
jgi:hypothetical protein